MENRRVMLWHCVAGEKHSLKKVLVERNEISSLSHISNGLKVDARGWLKKQKSLMVVDDDEAILQIVEKIFDSSEVEVLKARDGVQALKRIDACCAAIDVLLVDMFMPRLNGAELIRVVLTCHPEIKIIIMSGQTNEATKDAIIAAKIRYLRKPFSRDQLLQAVREELNKT